MITSHNNIRHLTPEIRYTYYQSYGDSIEDQHWTTFKCEAGVFFVEDPSENAAYVARSLAKLRTLLGCVNTAKVRVIYRRKSREKIARLIFW
jgi:hypothetical protein